MTARRIPILVHLAGAALASALAAYWVLRLMAPAPSMVAPPAPVASFREPDAGLAARLMGDVGSGPAASSLNIQVGGVFAAATDSSAVISVEGRPPRAVLLGRDVAPGFRLVEVRPDGITLEHEGVRTKYVVPAPTLAKATSSAPMFTREGDTLSAPSQDASAPGKVGLDASRPSASSGPPVAAQVPPGGAVSEEPAATPSRAARPRQSGPAQPATNTLPGNPPPGS
ncbi:MAG TPA: type II secretion system protein N [Burkholderiaceae bacterium]|nr:type II secretion system protein N [Burkholderiaceae bacterium]